MCHKQRGCQSTRTVGAGWQLRAKSNRLLCFSATSHSCFSFIPKTAHVFITIAHIFVLPLLKHRNNLRGEAVLQFQTPTAQKARQMSGDRSGSDPLCFLITVLAFVIIIIVAGDGRQEREREREGKGERESHRSFDRF